MASKPSVLGFVDLLMLMLMLETPRLETPRLETPSLRTPSLRTPRLETPRAETLSPQPLSPRTPSLRTLSLQTLSLQRPRTDRQALSCGRVKVGETSASPVLQHEALAEDPTLEQQGHHLACQAATNLLTWAHSDGFKVHLADDVAPWRGLRGAAIELECCHDTDDP